MLETIVKYFERVGIALSVLFNVIVGGYSNQSFSARNYQWAKDGKPNLVRQIDWVFYQLTGETQHCLVAWTYWYVRKHHNYR